MPLDPIKADPLATPQLPTAPPPTAPPPTPPTPQAGMPFEPATPEPVTLRRATVADCEALALVGAATFLEALTWLLPGSDLVAHCTRVHTAVAYREALSRPATHITLATAGQTPGDGAPVGYTLLCEPELPSFDVQPTDLELKRIYLFSRFRAAPVVGLPGVRPAQALLDAAVADARALRRTRLLLGTHANNLRAIRFYRRNGFVEAGTRTFQVGSLLCSDLIFARAIDTEERIRRPPDKPHDAIQPR